MVLVREGELAPEVAVFVNRLSDFLFVAARYAALKTQAVEEIYAKAKGLRERSLAGAAAAMASAPQSEEQKRAKAEAKEKKGGAYTEADGREDDDRSSVSSNGSGKAERT